MDSRHIAVLLACVLFAGGCLDDGLVNSDSTGTLAQDPAPQNVVIAAVGLATQPAVLQFAVPALRSDITGARLRWVGRGTNPGGDASLLINGHQRVGTLIASQNVGGDAPWMFLYEYDAMALVRTGNNRLYVSGFDLGGPMRTDGIAVAVSYNDSSSPWTAIHYVEPNEFVRAGAGAVWEFPIGFSRDARNARFVLVAGDCAATGSDRIWWSAGSGPAPVSLVGDAPNMWSDRLAAGAGDWMDVLTEDVAIPTAAAHFAYQLESPADGAGDDIVHLLGVLCIDGQPTSCAASVSGRVWHDGNLDGVEGGDEPGLAGVSVELRDGSDGALATTTDASGAFSFEGLCTGEYVLVLDEATLPADFIATSCEAGACSPYELVLEADDSVVSGLAFGWAALPPPEDACFYEPGFWRIQYASLVEDGRCVLLPADLLLALLEIVQATTARDWTQGDGSLDPEDALAMLQACGPDACSKAEYNYLACLLNFAFNDAHRGVPVDTDGDGEVDGTMGAVIDTIEPLLAAEEEGGCWDARALAISVNETPSADNCVY